MRSFHLISAGFNCENYVRPCLDSILKCIGNHQVNWYICNDASTDNTQIVIDFLKPTENLAIYSISNEKKMGSAYSRFSLMRRAISLAQPNDIVVQLDLDDYLLGDAFNTWTKVYDSNTRICATFGNFKSDYNVKIRKYSSKELDRKAYLNPNINFCFKPARTFLGKFLSNIKYKHMFVRGKLLTCCTDVALILPVVTQLNATNIVYLEEPLYYYRKRVDATSKTHKNQRQIFEDLKRQWRNTIQRQ